jgi:methionyl-tRNA synthetase
MISRYREGALRRTDVPDELAVALDRARLEVAVRLDEFDLTGGLELVWELVRRLNRHVEQIAPWELAKDEARADELDRALYSLADGLRAVAVALAAFIPDTSNRILSALGQPAELAWDGVAAGRTIAAVGIDAAPPLFPRVDAPTAAA